MSICPVFDPAGRMGKVMREGRKYTLVFQADRGRQKVWGKDKEDRKPKEIKSNA